MTSPDERLARIEARLELRELVARYALAVDDKDIAALADLFTVDARLSFRSGLAPETIGRDNVAKVYKERLALMHHSFHVVHDQLITFVPEQRGVARGVVTAHAEMWRNEQVELAAIRYFDDYRIEEGGWKIAARNVAFFYYLPIAEYGEYFGELKRVRAGRPALAADFPEHTTRCTEVL